MEETLDLQRLSSPAEIAARLFDEHVADIVQALNLLPPELAADVLGLLPLERATDVLDQPDLEEAEGMIALLPEAKAAALLDAMSADRLANLFRHMEEPPRGRLAGLLTPDANATVARLLAYPRHSAGGIMTTEFVSVPTSWTVGETLRHIRLVESGRETVYAIYVVDPVTHKLSQSVSLRRLISGDPQAPVASVAKFRRPVTVSPATDREEVARLISKYDLLAIPVVDEREHILGIVTVDDIIDTILDETTEDAHKFGGMEALGEPYMQIGLLEMLRKRAGWLCILLIGEMLTASAMQYFQDELEKAVVLTLFIPLIMSSGGNSGSQATSLIIRALALGEIRMRDWWRIALRELPTGIALGAILGVIGMTRVAVWQSFGLFDYGPHWQLVALTVGLALVGIVTFGSLAGSMLPFALKRVGFDPASASAPFVATLVDVSGLVIYFTVALLVLRGTLL